MFAGSVVAEHIPVVSMKRGEIMKRNSIVRLSVAIVVLFVLTSGFSAFAQGIKARMQARLPEIVALKAAGVVGEDSRGYLAFVGSAGQKADIVEAENEDRRQVYGAIAQQQGTTVDVVGKLRARQIAENAAPGEWLQNEQGQWTKK
jgi:uncharacterized protein YdbL (DUF1318 family)